MTKYSNKALTASVRPVVVDPCHLTAARPQILGVRGGPRVAVDPDHPVLALAAAAPQLEGLENGRPAGAHRPIEADERARPFHVEPLEVLVVRVD